MSDRYADGAYLAHNPTWHEEDAPWKADRIDELLRAGGVSFRHAVEVGCGTAGILAALQPRWPQDVLWEGWEIAPAAAARARLRAGPRLRVEEGDFLVAGPARVDLLLAIDVVEHVENPSDFCRRLAPRAEWKLFHFPLDLSVLSVARGWPLLTARRHVGHLTYYTRDLVLELLRESGLEVVRTAYTSIQLDGGGAVQVRMNRRWRRWLFRWRPDWTARWLGGFSLLVLAR